MTRSRRSTERVNVLLDSETVRKLNCLAKAESKSLSDVLRMAIERYHEERRIPRGAGVLDRNGFIGCAEGEQDSLTAFKRRFGELLSGKHGDR